MGKNRVTKADLIWSAACIIIVLLAHGLGYI